VNRKNWWHVPPANPNAYRERGKFLASSFREAEFWGRPLDDPQKVTVTRPLVGDDMAIEGELFGERLSTKLLSRKSRLAECSIRNFKNGKNTIRPRSLRRLTMAIHDLQNKATR
jgi:hypothetical protein